MTEDFLTRTRILLGEQKLQIIKQSRIVIFGVGGVGSYAMEALVRAGVGQITIVDYDTIQLSNLNRQLITSQNNIGHDKVIAAKERALSINPEIVIDAYKEKVTEDNADQFIPLDTSYVVDAIDDIVGKFSIIRFSRDHNIPVISSSGTGNRTMFKNYMIEDISKTHGCPLARKLRKKLKDNGIISGVTMLYSPEQPDITVHDRNIGSISFVPAQAGLKLAEKVINDLISV